MIEVKNLSMIFELGRYATPEKKVFETLHDINLDIKKGEYIALIEEMVQGKALC